MWGWFVQEFVSQLWIVQPRAATKNIFLTGKRTNNIQIVIYPYIKSIQRKWYFEHITIPYNICSIKWVGSCQSYSHILSNKSVTCSSSRRGGVICSFAAAYSKDKVFSKNPLFWTFRKSTQYYIQWIIPKNRFIQRTERGF